MSFFLDFVYGSVCLFSYRALLPTLQCFFPCSIFNLSVNDSPRPSMFARLPPFLKLRPAELLPLSYL